MARATRLRLSVFGRAGPIRQPLLEFKTDPRISNTMRAQVKGTSATSGGSSLERELITVGIRKQAFRPLVTTDEFIDTCLSAPIGGMWKRTRSLSGSHEPGSTGTDNNDVVRVHISAAPQAV